MGVVHLSGFATYTVLHATGQADVSFTIGGAALTQNQPFDWGFDRQNWIVGGKLVVGLASPL